MATEGSVYYFKMNNGDNIIAEVIHVEQDALGQKQYLVTDPMLIEYRDVNGQLAMALNRFFSFTDYNMAEFKDRDITTVMSINKSFLQYYQNTVRYNYLYLDKSTTHSIKEMNKIVATAVSKPNKEFIEAMKKYNIDPDSFLDQLPN